MAHRNRTPLALVIGLAALAATGCADGPLSPDRGPVGTGDLFASFSHVGTNVVPVNDGNLGVDWLFGAETGSGSGSFVAGPGVPHTGSGSAEINITGSADGFVLAGAILAGTKLDDIDKIEYGTYRSVGNPAWAISLAFNMNYDPTTNPTNSWQGRLVFEPYYGATVLTGAWQSWNPLTQEGWWATLAPGNGVCPINNPCTWTEVLAAFPNAHVRAEPVPVIFKAGSGWGTFTGNVDGLTVSVSGVETTWDFGPAPVNPTTTGACQQGGWSGFGFKNQGQCIRFVNTGKDSR